MKNFKGVFTALATPFKKGKVDYESLEKLIAQQLDSGIDGFVFNGTTGESPVLSEKERKTLFTFAKKKLKGRCILIFGAGGNNTEEVIKLAKEASRLGADAILSVVPYYNKPTQKGLYLHFSKIAKSVKTPVILYNVPGRTITALTVETIAKLSKIKNIIGIKEASGNIETAKKIRETCGPKFILLSGDDGTYEEFLAAGGNGIISVASHILPKSFKRGIIKEKLELINYLYVESNPIPVKFALKRKKLFKSAELRLPLTELDKSFQGKMNELLEKFED